MPEPAINLLPGELPLKLYEGNLVSFGVRFSDINLSARTFSLILYDAELASVFSFTVVDSYSAPDTVVTIDSGATVVPVTWNGLKWEFKDETVDRVYIKGVVEVEAR